MSWLENFGMDWAGVDFEPVYLVDVCLVDDKKEKEKRKMLV